MPANQIAKILTAARELSFERHDTLFVEGTPVQRVMLLVSGVVKITQVGESGMQVILRLNGPGDVIGVQRSAKHPPVHCATAEAVQPCRVVVWDAMVFDDFLEAYPQLQRNLHLLLQQCLEELAERFREVATERVNRRVANALVRLVRQVGRPVNGAMEVSLSREELGQMTGTTLFTVSRLLSEWQTLGIVVGRREAVLVRSIDALLANVVAG